MSIPELEIQLSQHGNSTYLSASLRRADKDIATDPSVSDIHIDQRELLALSLSNADYGAHLTRILFANQQIDRIWSAARAITQQGELRVRLRCSLGSPEIHGVRWELLHDPQSARPLARMAGVYFSRMLDTAEVAPVPINPRDDLRAVVLVANPSDLSRYRLTAIDIATEVNLAREALGDIPVTALTTGQREMPASLDTLLAQLRRGVTICYIVAHGMRAAGESVLMLEGANGAASPVNASDFAARIGELQERPLLMVVAACQSANTIDAPDVMRALGPLLIAAGVPAVIVMQDNVPVDVIRRMMPVFFRDLRAHGVIDRAMAVARSTLNTDASWWHPVLFMQLREGRLWQEVPPDPKQRMLASARWASGGLTVLIVTAMVVKLQRAGLDFMVGVIIAALLLITGGCLALLTPSAQRWMSRPLAGVAPRLRAALLWLGPLLLVLQITLGVYLALPYVARPYADQGMEMLRQGRPVEALAALDRAISLNPYDAIAYYHRGIAQEDLAQGDLAETSYYTAINLDPKLSSAYNNLARLLLSEGRQGQALTWFQQIDTRNLQDPLALYALYKNLGWANLESTPPNYHQAEDDLRRALSYNSTGSAAHCLLARVLEERPTPDRAGALEAWATCLRYEFAGETVDPALLNRARERLSAE